MAESFLFSIAESLIAKLASHAFQEASRLVDLYDNLRDLTKTLSLVKAVLLDAQQKQEHNHQLREWLLQLKTVFSDAEDVLDEFECQTLRRKVVKAHGSTKDKVSHFFSTSNPLVFRYKMVQQIKDISNRLDKVAADRHKFSLQIIDVDTRVVHRRDMTHSRVSDSQRKAKAHSMKLMVKVFALVQILLVALFPAAHALRRDEFPPEFVFGASTSAYQVLLSLSLITPFHLSPFTSRHFILQCTLLFLFLIMSYTIYERLKVQPMRMAGSQAHGIP